MSQYAFNDMLYGSFTIAAGVNQLPAAADNPARSAFVTDGKFGPAFVKSGLDASNTPAWLEQAGTKLLYGATSPSALLGSVSDSYFNTATGALYEKTGLLTWTLRFNFYAGLATVATTGDYNDLINKPSARSKSAVTRTLNTIFQVSSTRDAWVLYSVQITVTASIGGGQNGDVILETATNAGFTTGVETVSISGIGQTLTLAITLNSVQPQTQLVGGFVAQGLWARLRTVNNTGTPAFSYRAGQEVLL